MKENSPGRIGVSRPSCSLTAVPCCWSVRISEAESSRAIMRRPRVTICGPACTVEISIGPSRWLTMVPGEGRSSRNSTAIGTKAWVTASCQLSARSAADSGAVLSATDTAHPSLLDPRPFGFPA